MLDEGCGVYSSHGEYAELRTARQVFKRVTEAYLDARQAPPLVACTYDERVSNRKLGANLIHFIVDVENATARALGNNQALLKQWKKLVFDGENIPNKSAVVGRCGRIYRIRGLIPRQYFTRVRKGRADHRSLQANAPQAGAE